MKVEVDVPNKPVVSVDVKQHFSFLLFVVYVQPSSSDPVSNWILKACRSHGSLRHSDSDGTHPSRFFM